MLSSALTLAILTTAGFYVAYSKLPRRVRRWIENHSLLTDTLCLLLTYMLLGGTLTALVAAAMVGLMTSALLYIANHPSDFIFLSDFGTMVSDFLRKLKEGLAAFSKEYNAKHHPKAAEVAAEAAADGQ